jgi:uncharacterized membrane protein
LSFFSDIPRRLLGYFLRGLLFVSPIVVTVYAMYAVVTFLDSLIPGLYPGLSIVAILVSITVIGFYSYSWLFQSFLGFLERLIFRTPGLKLIYTSIKDLLGGLVGSKKAFNQPVIVLMNKEAGLRKIGFLTKHDLSHAGIDGLVAVYFPHSYNFSGELFLVPMENVTLLKDFAPANAMKFIVSGGVTEIDEDTNDRKK